MRAFIISLLLLSLFSITSLAAALEILPRGELSDRIVDLVPISPITSGGGGNASFNQTLLDTLYLRLDASNDPLTGMLVIRNDLNVSGDINGSRLFDSSSRVCTAANGLCGGADSFVNVAFTNISNNFSQRQNVSSLFINNLHKHQSYQSTKI